VKEHLAKKMKTIEEDICLVASMGSSLYKKGSDIDDFIKTADYAMYETKISKKKREN
jgi:PleD family two-component response regulator